MEAQSAIVLLTCQDCGENSGKESTYEVSVAKSFVKALIITGTSQI